MLRCLLSCPMLLLPLRLLCITSHRFLPAALLFVVDTRHLNFVLIRCLCCGSALPSGFDISACFAALLSFCYILSRGCLVHHWRHHRLSARIFSHLVSCRKRSGMYPHIGCGAVILDNCTVDVFRVFFVQRCGWFEFFRYCCPAQMTASKIYKTY